MDVEAPLRLKEDEIKKLKAARAKDATRLKAAASKAKDKALAEQKRAHNVHITELGKELGDLKASKSLVEKEVVRCNRRVSCLEADLAERELQRQQVSKDYLWLQNEHAEVELNMAILRKEHEALKKELADCRRSTDALEERHKDKIERLNAEMAEWRDSHLSLAVPTKVHKGLHSPCTPDFEHCSRGMLATGIAASTCVDTFTRCADYFLTGKARDAAVNSPERLVFKIEGVCWVCGVRACRACDCRGFLDNSIWT